MPAKAGKKHRKVGRNGRKPGARYQFMRTYRNKLVRLNRDRKKQGMEPLLVLGGYNPATGEPDAKV